MEDSHLPGGYAMAVDGPTGFAGWITGTFANSETVPVGQQGAADDPEGDGGSAGVARGKTVK